jgi:hypothetical protein
MQTARDIALARGPRTATGRRPPWWAVAVVAGLLLGPLDLWGQVVAPYPWAHLCNSPAVWAAAAFAYGRWTRAVRPAAAGGTVLLVVAVEAYYAADVVVRGADAGNLTSSVAALWLVAAVLAGVVFGTAGAWSHGPAGWRGVVGRAALPAVFGAEAVRAVVRIATEPADGRPDDLGPLAVLLGLLAVASLVWLTRGVTRRTCVLVVAVAAAAALVVGVPAGAVV